MQNNQKIIAVFGGGGFLGKHLMRQLTKLDFRVKVATRNPYLKGYLKPLGNPGQIELIKTNIFDSEDVKRVLNNCDFAINLVGILYETRKQKFNQIHAQFPYILSNLCNETGIKNLIHVSALGVKEGHLSKYMQSKLQGEKNTQEGTQPSKWEKLVEINKKDPILLSDYTDQDRKERAEFRRDFEFHHDQ